MFHKGKHTEEHHPVDRRGCHAAADAAQLWHPEMTVNKDIVHRNIHQQADKAHHHPGLGFRQAFALVTRHLEEEVARCPPEQGTQIAHGFVSQCRVNVIHRANDMTGVPEHDHNQHGDKSGQPEPLADLMGNAFATSRTIKLSNNRRQREQQTMAEQDGRKPD